MPPHGTAVYPWGVGCYRAASAHSPPKPSAAELVFLSTECIENTLQPKDVNSFLILELMLFLTRELTEQILRGRDGHATSCDGEIGGDR